MQTLNSNQLDLVSGGSFFEGLAIVGGTILAVALAPEAIAIGSVAGIAALVTEGAGAVVMNQ